MSLIQIAAAQLEISCSHVCLFSEYPPPHTQRGAYGSYYDHQSYPPPDEEQGDDHRDLTFQL
jgi:hypothetical protein